MMVFWLFDVKGNFKSAFKNVHLEDTFYNVKNATIHVFAAVNVMPRHKFLPLTRDLLSFNKLRMDRFKFTLKVTLSSSSLKAT